MLYKSLQLKDATVNLETRIITAYSSTWDLDEGRDIIKAGSFTKTIAERLDRVKVLRNHNQLIGRAISAKEDGKGLLTESYIGKHDLGEETLMLAKDGILDSMSIGYSVPNGKSSYDGDIRTITEVKLYEWSVVDFPMNEAARILDVKSLEQKLKSGNITLDELTRLSTSIDELKALLSNEPSNDTQDGLQPHEATQLKDALNLFGC